MQGIRRSVRSTMIPISAVMAVALLYSTSNAQKVAICHIPPNDPENVHSIEIERNALKDHLEHGDYLGACREDEENYFTVTVAPNPYFEHTSVKYTLYEPANIKMEIYDQIGKRIKVLVDGDVEPGKYTSEFNAGDYGIKYGVLFLKVVRKTADKEFVHFERLVELH